MERKFTYLEHPLLTLPTTSHHKSNLNLNKAAGHPSDSPEPPVRQYVQSSTPQRPSQHPHDTVPEAYDPQLVAYSTPPNSAR